MDSFFEKLRSLFKFFLYLFPFALIGLGIYFIYMNSVRNSVQKTISDVAYIVQNIYNNYAGSKYKGFATDVLIYNNILPLDMDRRMTDYGYEIYSRSGGLITAMESFATKNERMLYMSLIDNKARYQSIYGGVSAYILTFSGLNHSDCVLLAQIDWRSISNRYLGMEIAKMLPNAPYQGIYNLNHYLLVDNVGEEYKTLDSGILSRTNLSAKEAEAACRCALKDCRISLKFL